MQIRKAVIAGACGAALAATAVGTASAAPAAPAATQQVFSPHSSGCSGQAFSNGSGNFGSPGLANTSVAGHAGFVMGYVVTVDANGGNLSTAAIQVWGIDPKTNKAKWYPTAGPWDPGTGPSVRVPWGNNLATPKVRVASAPGPLRVAFNCT